MAGVLLVVGLGVGLGLRRGDGTPTVDQPRPMPTLTRPAPVPSTAPATGRLPGTFVGDLGGRLAVVSTRTGKVVRTRYGPHPFGTDSYTVGTSPDQTTVYFSHHGGDPCDLVVAEFQPRTGRLAAFERCVRTVSRGVARERFPAGVPGPRQRPAAVPGFAFNDPGNDLSVSSLDLDQSGRHLPYQVGSNPTW